MRTHVSSHPRVDRQGGSRRSPVRPLPRRPLPRLPIGALVAAIWADLDPQPYYTLAHRLAFPVNEIGMALFLALIAHEAIDAIGPGGALRHWRHWGVPLVAAAGSVAGAAFAFLPT